MVTIQVQGYFSVNASEQEAMNAETRTSTTMS